MDLESLTVHLHEMENTESALKQQLDLTAEQKAQQQAAAETAQVEAKKRLSSLQQRMEATKSTLETAKHDWQTKYNDLKIDFDEERRNWEMQEQIMSQAPLALALTGPDPNADVSGPNSD